MDNRFARNIAQDDRGIRFAPSQLEYLNKQFPEVVGNPDTSEAELRFRSGQRSVLAFINSKMMKE